MALPRGAMGLSAVFLIILTIFFKKKQTLPRFNVIAS